MTQWTEQKYWNTDQNVGDRKCQRTEQSQKHLEGTTICQKWTETVQEKRNLFQRHKGTRLFQIGLKFEPWTREWKYKLSTKINLIEHSTVGSAKSYNKHTMKMRHDLKMGSKQPSTATQFAVNNYDYNLFELWSLNHHIVQLKTKWTKPCSNRRGQHGPTVCHFITIKNLIFIKSYSATTVLYLKNV